MKVVVNLCKFHKIRAHWPLNLSTFQETSCTYHRENTASNNKHSRLFYCFKCRRDLSTPPSERAVCLGRSDPRQVSMNTEKGGHFVYNTCKTCNVVWEMFRKKFVALALLRSLTIYSKRMGVIHSTKSKSLTTFRTRILKEMCLTCRLWWAMAVLRIGGNGHAYRHLLYKQLTAELFTG